MKAKQTLFRTSDPEGSHRLFFLLFYVMGALLARFVPSAAAVFPAGSRPLAGLLLIPVLFSGSLGGVYLIPMGGLILGACSLQRLQGFTSLAELLAQAPLLLFTPVYFLIAVGGMRLSEDCLSACSRGERSARSALLGRQFFLWAAALGTAFMIRFIL